MFYLFGALIFYLVFKFFFHLKIEGAHFIPQAGGAVICVNHNSWWDPPLVGVSVMFKEGRRLYYMAKKELFLFPFGFILRRVGAFPVKRDQADIKAFRTALGVVKQGRLLLLFPEGGRKRKNVQRGVGVIISRCNVPVVPACIQGTDRWKIFSCFRIRFGSPLFFGGQEKNHAEKVMAEVRKLKCEFTR